MSEEEQKAIKWFDTERKLVEITNGDNNYFSIILNYIDKLQKENENLRDTNKKLYEMCQQHGIQEILNEKWVSKDKIRDKIKELEKSIEEVTYTEEQEEQQYRNLGFLVSILKELLEEE